MTKRPASLGRPADDDPAEVHLRLNTRWPNAASAAERHVERKKARSTAHLVALWLDGDREMQEYLLNAIGLALILERRLRRANARFRRFSMRNRSDLSDTLLDAVVQFDDFGTGYSIWNVVQIAFLTKPEHLPRARRNVGRHRGAVRSYCDCVSRLRLARSGATATHALFEVWAALGHLLGYVMAELLQDPQDPARRWPGKREDGKTRPRVTGEARRPRRPRPRVAGEAR